MQLTPFPPQRPPHPISPDRFRRRRPRARWIFWIFALGASYWLGYHDRKLKPIFEDADCERVYERLYGSESEPEFRVVFGYKDARPARFVADRYERLLFIQRLTGSCLGTDLACGFSRDRGDADLLTRSIVGPDGQRKTVRVRVVQPSASADDLENRKDPFQRWKSKRAEEAFLKGFHEAAVVLYNGHSRAGGGPDFEPPRLNPAESVDFTWYKAHEPGFAKVLDALKEEASARTRMLGFYSCASHKLFTDRVREIRPDLGLVTSSRLIYFSDALETSLETLNSLFSMKCEKGFRSALRTPKTRAGGARVSGFFRKSSAPGGSAAQ